MSAQQRFLVGIITAVAAATIGITFTLAFLFIAPDDRGQKFFLSLGAVVLAEILIFSDLILETGRSEKDRATLPFNIGMSFALFIYLVIACVLAAIAATPVSLTVLISGHLIALLGLILFLGIWAIGRRYVADRDIDTSNKRATMLEIRRKCAAIVAMVDTYTSEEFLPLRKAVHSLNEELKYAATLSSDKSIAIEGEIKEAIQRIEVHNFRDFADDEIQSACNEIETIVRMVRGRGVINNY